MCESSRHKEYNKLYCDAALKTCVNCRKLFYEKQVVHCDMCIKGFVCIGDVIECCTCQRHLCLVHALECKICSQKSCGYHTYCCSLCGGCFCKEHYLHIFYCNRCLDFYCCDCSSHITDERDNSYCVNCCAKCVTVCDACGVWFKTTEEFGTNEKCRNRRDLKHAYLSRCDDCL